MMQDLISRQAAIDALQKEINKGKPPFDDVIGSIRCGVRLARNIIEDLPSAQPEHSAWVNSKDGYSGHVKCKACFKTYDWDSEAQYFNFCPNCGADMKGADDEQVDRQSALQDAETEIL